LLQIVSRLHFTYFEPNIQQRKYYVLIFSADIANILACIQRI